MIEESVCKVPNNVHTIYTSKLTMFSFIIYVCCTLLYVIYSILGRLQLVHCTMCIICCCPLNNVIPTALEHHNYLAPNVLSIYIYISIYFLSLFLFTFIYLYLSVKLFFTFFSFYFFPLPLFFLLPSSPFISIHSSLSLSNCLNCLSHIILNFLSICKTLLVN